MPALISYNKVPWTSNCHKIIVDADPKKMCRSWSNKLEHTQWPWSWSNNLCVVQCCWNENQSWRKNPMMINKVLVELCEPNQTSPNKLKKILKRETKRILSHYQCFTVFVLPLNFFSCWSCHLHVFWQTSTPAATIITQRA